MLTTLLPRLTARWAAFVLAVWLPNSELGHAVTIVITDPTPTYTDIESPAAPHSWAKVTAHLWTTPVSLANDLYFEDAWNAWNNARPVADRWTLVNGGALAATLNVSIFDAHSFHNNGHPGNAGVGGVEIQVDLVYNGADRDDLVWSQGLYLNYQPPNFAILPGFSTMDTASFSGFAVPPAWADPVYPFQYNDERFYDYPKAPYDSGFFEADALLSKVNYTTKTLTVYDGVHYGFYLSVPDASSSFSLLLLSLVVIQLLRPRKSVDAGSGSYG